MFLVAALAVALAVTGWITAVADWLTLPRAVALVVALVLAVIALRSWSQVRILPFRDLLDSADPARTAPVVAGFAEVLRREVRRIADLLTQEPFREPAAVLNPASGRGQTARQCWSREPFITGLAASGVQGAGLKATELGTVTLGPMKLQIGGVLALLSGLRWRTLQGSLVQEGKTITVTAVQSGQQGGTWIEQIEVGPDTGRSVALLARRLAHQIQPYQRGWSGPGGDWHGFQLLVDGLDRYREFLHEGTLAHLEEAELLFRKAVAHSPNYAAAYHNLATVKSELDRVRSSLGLPVSPDVSEAAETLWRRAVELDPGLAPAWFQLARAALDRAEETEDRDGRRVLLEQAVESARAALPRQRRRRGARPERILAHYWLGQALLDRWSDPGAAEDSKRASGLAESLRYLRCAEQDLRDLRARLRAQRSSEPEIQQLNERIARILAEQATCRLELSQAGTSRSKRHQRCAHRGFRAAITLASNPADLLARYACMKRALGKNTDGSEEFLRAAQWNPHNRRMMLGLGPITDKNRRNWLKTVLTVAVHQKPGDLDRWLASTTSPPVPKAATAGTEAGPDGQPPAVDRDKFRRCRHAWPGPAESEQSGAALLDTLCKQIGSAPRFKRAVKRVATSRSQSVTARESADADRPSDRQRRCLQDAARNLSTAVDIEIPELPTPPLWRVELGEIQLALGDSHGNAGHGDEARNAYRKAENTFTAVLREQPVRMNTRYPGQPARDPVPSVVLVGDPPQLPARARALAGRARARANQGRYADALTDCNDALRLAPLFVYPRFIKAELHLRRAQFSAAEESLQRIFDLEPAGQDLDRAHRELAAVFRTRATTTTGEERKELLERAYEQLIIVAKAPRPSTKLDVQVNDDLVDVLELLGRSDEAVTVLRAVVSTPGCPREAGRRARLAGLLAFSGRYAEAEAELCEAWSAGETELKQARGTDEEAQLEADLAGFRRRLALFYAEQRVRLGDADQLAEGALDVAMRLGLGGGALAEFKDTRGWVQFLRTGKPADPIGYFKEALAESCGDAEKWAHLAITLEAEAASAGGRRRWQSLAQARDSWQQIRDHHPSSGWITCAVERLGRLPDRPHPPMALAASNGSPRGIRESRPPS
ncbi:hypothetical protein ACFC1R_21100 [Kitasatospora sp. NPDC056138]|uniref:tetratricopeptide repeat protein n=1 Tax=Kitasatospora sp. NPDC056138 TaxID=3345724 RepID=UPI0035D7756D